MLVVLLEDDLAKTNPDLEISKCFSLENAHNWLCCFNFENTHSFVFLFSFCLTLSSTSSHIINVFTIFEMQVRNFINIGVVASMTASTTVMAFSATPTAVQNMVATSFSQITVPATTFEASEKTAAPAKIAPFDAPFYDAEAAAATMKEAAADLEEAAEEELDEYDFKDLEKDVDELIKTITEGSKHFIEAWSYKNLMDIHIPVPSKVLTTASRGMDAVTKVIELMSRTAGKFVLFWCFFIFPLF